MIRFSVTELNLTLQRQLSGKTSQEVQYDLKDILVSYHLVYITFPLQPIQTGFYSPTRSGVFTAVPKNCNTRSPEALKNCFSQIKVTDAKNNCYETGETALQRLLIFIPVRISTLQFLYKSSFIRNQTLQFIDVIEIFKNFLNK